MEIKKIDKNVAIRIIEYMGKKHLNYIQARAFIEHLHIDNKTAVMRDAFPYVPVLLEKLYNPADFGMWGKLGEVEERLARWYDNKRPVCMWSELHARKSGKSDLNSKCQEEMKTGAGDWLYSTKNADRESIIEEYRHKQTIIYWKTEFFAIRCTWEQLFDYMETYNEKGVEQFFKANIKYNAQLTKSVCMLQEWKTSKKKIAFFAACPYNMD